MTVPKQVDMKGEEFSNWIVFRSQWEPYEIAMGLDKKENRIRAHTLLAVIDKGCHSLQQPPAMSRADQEDPCKILEVLQKHFKPTNHVLYKRFVKQL